MILFFNLIIYNKIFSLIMNYVNLEQEYWEYNGYNHIVLPNIIIIYHENISTILIILLKIGFNMISSITKIG